LSPPTEEPTETPTATVRYAGEVLVLAERTDVIVGRGSAAGLTVGRSPVDTRVSRQHLSLSLDDGMVTVTRLSRTQLVLVRTASSTFSLDGPGDSVRRGGAFTVLLPRTPGPDDAALAYHRLDIEAPGPGEPASADTPRPDATSETTAKPVLSDRDQVLLAAYARPLLLHAGDDEPAAATHQQVAQTLHYSYEWCRERIDRLRRRLADEGWPVGPDKDSLCRWAVAMRIVSEDDLSSDEPDGTDV